MKASKRAYNLIKEFESLQLKSYRCPAGVWTIGYGNTSMAKEGMIIDKKTAEEFLQRDIREMERAIESNVRASVLPLLTQNQFDALISFIFNVGVGNFQKSTLLRKLNEGDIKQAVDEFMKWTKAKIDGEYKDLPGLIKRRTKEREVFLER